MQKILSVPTIGVGKNKVTSETPIMVERDEDVGYEKRRWPYILTMPILWLLTLWVIAKKTMYRWSDRPGPVINTFWFDGLGQANRAIKDGAASWRALDIIYNHPFSQNGVGSLADNFWIGMMNAQAVRNRLKLTKQEIRRAILTTESESQEIRLLSLAAGSAQAVIEAMAEMKAEGSNVQALLLDIDPTALDYAMQLAIQHGVAGQVETIRTNIARVVRIAREFRPNLIEMVGLLEYISTSQAIRLVRKIYQSLEPEGVFLTCTIIPNPEMHFLRWVINWPMIYRSPAELAEIIAKAGFTNFRLISEPLGIHTLVVARKEET